MCVPIASRVLVPTVPSRLRCRTGRLPAARIPARLTWCFASRSRALAAAAGLVVFFVGAVLTHLRAGVLYNIAFPGAYLCLSAASLAWMALR